MTSPTRRITDPGLAGQWARKRFGKFGMVRHRRIRIPSSPKHSFDLYEVGVCDGNGEFLVKGDSSFDYADAFYAAGHQMDARDPIFLRSDLRFCNEIAESESVEQVEMF